MEDEAELGAESSFSKLNRLVRERDVRSFVLLWPLGARLHGLEVELGFLLTHLYGGTLRPSDVCILAGVGTFGVEDGVISLSEPGNRTRYHQDLVDLGCPVARWRDSKSLFLRAATIALDR